MPIESSNEKTAVVCAVIVRNGMVLAASRAQNISHAGRWEFPGGKVIEGKSHIQSIIEHVKTELGLDIIVRDKMDSFEAVNREGRTFEMYPFFVEIPDGESIHLVRHDRAEWFMPIQLLQLAWPTTDMPIIDEILDRIIKRGTII